MKSTSVVAALIIAAGVIAVPLVIKSHQATNTQGGNQSLPSTGGAPQAAQALPRFVDLGTTTCAPCRVMLGVMEELKQKYPGAMTVEFVNVRENPAEAQSYGIQMIPTQIFFGPDGRELYRHIGVFRTDAVIAKWAELGFKFKAPTEG